MVWGGRGASVLKAIEYFNPDDVYEPSNLKHVRLIGVQVVMTTPEEVIGLGQLGDTVAMSRPASMFDLGRSPWLASFAPRHLGECRHFQLLFYDELVDVICEKVECVDGPYLNAAQPGVAPDGRQRTAE